MSKKHHNYTNYSKPKTTPVEPVVDEVKVEPTEILGVVTNCMKLNVREEANAEANILCTIKLADEVMVNKEESTDEFYKVVTGAGVEGYCMKKFINVN